MKRDAQTFLWTCVAGLLTITDRATNRVERTYRISDYPEAIQGKIQDAGFKAVFQQRTSQIDNDREKLAAWDALDELFAAGTWEREGSRRAPIVSAWVEVLAEVKGVEVGTIQKSLAGYTKEQRAKIRESVEAKHADKIKARVDARKDETISLDDLA